LAPPYIGNEAEMALLQQEVLADLLTKSYEEGLYNIYELADFFTISASLPMRAVGLMSSL